MKVISFFLQYWGSADPARTRYARRMVVFVILASIIAGGVNTALLASVNAALYTLGQHTPEMVWSFVVLCLLMAVARFCSEALFNVFLLNVMLEMQMSLARRILATPLQQLEQIGAPRLAAVLSN